MSRAVAKGHDFFNVLRAATFNPVRHYNLEVGLLQKDDFADIVVVKDLENFDIIQTYINGDLVAENGVSLINKVDFEPINKFSCEYKQPEDFTVYADKDAVVNVIEAIDGELITNRIEHELKSENGKLSCDLENDVLKITVVNRYDNSIPHCGFIKNFGLKSGAVASSIAHDSHNIIAIGTNDKDLCDAVNLIIQHKGGIAVTDKGDSTVLPLPLAGLMSIDDAQTTAEKYKLLNQRVKELGSQLHSPFMTLSFMALLVIPSIKLSDKGLFDGRKFEFIDLIAG